MKWLRLVALEHGCDGGAAALIWHDAFTAREEKVHNFLDDASLAYIQDYSRTSWLETILHSVSEGRHVQQSKGIAGGLYCNQLKYESRTPKYHAGSTYMPKHS